MLNQEPSLEVDKKERPRINFRGLYVSFSFAGAVVGFLFWIFQSWGLAMFIGLGVVAFLFVAFLVHVFFEEVDKIDYAEEAERELLSKTFTPRGDNL
jgi:uncharacterized membrane protein